VAVVVVVALRIQLLVRMVVLAAVRQKPVAVLLLERVRLVKEIMVAVVAAILVVLVAVVVLVQLVETHLL
jgi:hypothetical protein